MKFDMCRAKLKGKGGMGGGGGWGLLSKWRYARVAILYSQRNSTGSQCRSSRFLRTSRAALL